MVPLAAALLSAERPARADNFRMIRRIGVYATRNGDPFPSYVGVNLGINVSPMLRVHGGGGSVTRFKTDPVRVGGGVKMMVPGWDFTPIAGVGVSDATDSAYYSAGLDFQALGGLNAGVGYNRQFRHGPGSYFGQLGVFW